VASVHRCALCHYDFLFVVCVVVFCVESGPALSLLFPYTTLFRSKNVSVSCAYTQGKREQFSGFNRTLDAINNVFERPVKAAELRSEERFSRNAETDLVCRLLLEQKNRTDTRSRSLERTQ